MCVCVFMLHTCALQEGGVLSDRAPPQPVRQTYTVGQSYYTSSGRVVTMTTTDSTLAVSMDTGWLGRQVKGPLLCTADDVATGGRLVPIGEVKTLTSPPEQPARLGHGVRGVSGGEAFQGGGPASLRGGAASLLLPRTPPDKLSPTHSPSTASVVCRVFGWRLAWKQA